MDEQSPMTHAQLLAETCDDRQLDTLFIRDLVLDCSIGIHPHERTAPQRVRFNIELKILPSGAAHTDDPRHIVCYDALVALIRQVAEAGHIQLVETMAERIAQRCLAFPGVAQARVSVEKLDRFPGASLGVEILRRKAAHETVEHVRLNGERQPRSKKSDALPRS